MFVFFKKIDQCDFLKQLSYRIFFSKNTTCNSLKSVRTEYEEKGLGTLSKEHSLSFVNPYGFVRLIHSLREIEAWAYLFRLRFIGAYMIYKPIN